MMVDNVEGKDKDNQVLWDARHPYTNNLAEAERAVRIMYARGQVDEAYSHAVTFAQSINKLLKGEYMESVWELEEEIYELEVSLAQMKSAAKRYSRVMKNLYIPKEYELKRKKRSFFGKIMDAAHSGDIFIPRMEVEDVKELDFRRLDAEAGK